jgi:putative transcriptional regulator
VEVLHVFGLGKPRSKLGRFLDRNGIKQEWLSSESGLNRDSISDLCKNYQNSSPQERTMVKVISALRKHGFDVKINDFWE